jgi:hypothetical protein
MRVQHAHALVAEIAQRKLVEGALRDSLEQLRAASARLEALHADSQQARRRSELLCGFAASIARARNLDDVFAGAFDVIEQALDTQRASIMTLLPLDAMDAPRARSGADTDR